MMNNEENAATWKPLLSSAFSGTASTAAKASPGLVVTGISFAGISLDTWVTILTILYLIFMLIGAIPKVGDTIKYLWKFRFHFKRKEPPLVINIHNNDEVQKKIDKTLKH